MPIWVVIVLVVIGGLFVLKLAYVVSVGWLLPVTRGALFVSTASSRVRAFLDAVPMEPAERLFDLGCGDGRVLRAAAKRYGVHAVGFEVNPLAFATGKVLSAGRRNVSVRYGNFWQARLSDADVVFCYLFPDLMKRLKKKLESELQPGARVVSCNFPMPGWRPERILRPKHARHGDPIYVYRFPDATDSGPGGNILEHACYT